MPTKTAPKPTEPGPVPRPTVLHVQIDPQVEAALAKYGEKLVKDFPGVRWDKSAVVRNLLIGGLQLAGAMK